MNADRIIYRTRQFWHALGSTPSSEDMALVNTLLTPPQRTVFTRMQRSEQAHALLVLHTLLDQCEEDKDLLVAALLHDVGKSRFPLHLWERVVIVLAKKFCPECVQRWGEMNSGNQQAPRGWRRAFQIAEEHPTWGAEIAVDAGCSQMSVNLIRRHQEEIPDSEFEDLCIEDRLLLKLQAADDES
jgi:putative nucleotidyltransferase with HDIG domain